MNILIITPTSWQVVGFRISFINELMGKGHTVNVITFDKIYQKEIEARGIKFYYFNDSNRSKNIFKLLNIKKKYMSYIRKINPDIVFTYMLKPNIFGVIAAKKEKISKVYSTVEGTGDIFTSKSFKTTLIRIFIIFLYKRAFKQANKVFFLNPDDRNEFVKLNIVDIDKTHITNGIGINLLKFQYKEIVNHNSFLMVSRLSTNKGIIEYCEAAQSIKKNYQNVTFTLVGAEGNINLKQISRYLEDGSIIYRPFTNQIEEFYINSSVFVLPSYKEGFPVSVMEAQATGRMVITTNTNGCRETIINGYNGYLVDVANIEQLVEKISWCIENREKVSVMGSNARKFAIDNFDENVINEKIIKLLDL